jgi:long-chain acyl-CoA synthetase
MPIADRVRNWSVTRPASIALTVGEKAVRYDELARKATRVSAGLANLTKSKNGRASTLAVAVGNHPSFPELFIGGTARCHVCAVLDTSWPSSLSAEVLSQLAPDLLVIDSANSDLAEVAASRQIPFLVVDHDGEEGYARWLERVAGADPLQHLRSGPASDRFFIGFTSGTTSVPKAFHRSRHSWFESLAAGGKLFRTAEHTYTIAPGPLAHGLALYALMESLDSGGTFVSSSRFGATSLLRQILETQGTTRLVVVPAMLASLVDAAGGQTISTVRSIVTAGSKLDIALQQKTRTIFPNATFFEYYGASELGFITVASDQNSDRGLGKAFPGVTIKIEGEDGDDVSPGTTGRILVKSNLICDGYLWGDDGAGFRRIGEWATVGDIGKQDEFGNLYLIGREGGMLITGGYNVYPSEIEDVIARHPSVEEAIVLGLPEQRLGIAESSAKLTRLK